MKCQSCGKKEATVKYYENINVIINDKGKIVLDI